MYPGLLNQSSLGYRPPGIYERTSSHTHALLSEHTSDDSAGDDSLEPGSLGPGRVSCRLTREVQGTGGWRELGQQAVCKQWRLHVTCTRNIHVRPCNINVSTFTTCNLHDV